MKKKKSDHQSSVEFRSNPFAPLKGFIAPPAQKRTGSSPRRKAGKHEDDSALFLQAVSGARTRERDAPATTRPAGSKAAEKPNDVDPEDRQLFLQAMQKIGTVLRDRPPEQDKADEQRHRSSSGRMKQLRRGAIRISQELDLHGFLRDEALNRLERFISGAYSRGLEAVLVITGKGHNSPEGPVLQGAVAAWLRERGRGMIVEFFPAPREKGGSGAFVVFLKKK